MLSSNPGLPLATIPWDAKAAGVEAAVLGSGTDKGEIKSVGGWRNCANVSPEGSVERLLYITLRPCYRISNGFRFALQVSRNGGAMIGQQEQNQAFLEWEAKQRAIRQQMKKGQLDENSASLMSEQASQEYISTVQETTSPAST